MSFAISASGSTTIKLSGSLAKKFGRTHLKQIDSGTAREVFKALGCTIEGFEQEIKRLAARGMRFAVFRNRRNIGEADFGLGGTSEVRIVPVIEGSKRGGVLQTVVGVVLLAISYAFPVTAPYLTPAGIGLVAGGVIQMLSPQASGLKQSASPENLPSYAFGSAKNTTASGNPVPICIGERRWGGVIISASIYAEDKI
ncbi:tail assembly protein [Pseudomonas sp. GW456-L14]|uniref:tail assembly protein n=1 Tax=unclassified Pseudomonas TaxID=196821 RepID=UPI000C885601|nr:MULTISPECIES: tail assembly protein [unclassified Pseudomonas]PMY37305.1 tail assembly protein [Pseudomonas sp. GW456-L14]PMY59378.1 tail assembly protein [Pseudomonas sp. GW456-L12]